MGTPTHPTVGMGTPTHPTDTGRAPPVGPDPDYVGKALTYIHACVAKRIDMPLTKRARELRRLGGRWIQQLG
eukprot:2970615-Pyramimonas_sp.AAC.1